jgi:hypothetical protein
MSQVSRTLAKAILGAAILAAGSTTFAATDARTLLVTATIPGGCILSTTPMAFGTLNVAGTTDETHTATATIKCAVGISASAFTVGGVTPASGAAGTFNGIMTGAATNQALPYTITWTDPGTYVGQGFATGKDVPLLGTIRNADFVAKNPDNFAQTVLLSINF